MKIPFTIVQKERLTELSADAGTADAVFDSEKDRNDAFREIELEYVQMSRKRIGALLESTHEPETFRIEHDLSEWLMDKEGFTRVMTPTIISASMLDKMTITADNPLREQVFWLDQKKCLRPMLAPNLYVVMRELKRITHGPVKIFEIGSCFRKESQGALHMNEFTMLNLVELGSVEEGCQMRRLEELAVLAMAAAGIDDYELVREESAVYGETMDIVAGGVEIASGSYGPHRLDSNWGISDTWVGLGLGIERIALVRGGYRTIRRVGRSIAFIDGSPLSI